MNKQEFDINALRVASPCSVGWQTMTGDDRVRRCHSCQLNIYNTTEMTKNEVEDLIQNHEGRLCIRLYKRADGTVLTKDCPVGFRAYQKRLSRFAGATLTAILSIFSTSFGQKEGVDKMDATSKEVKIVRADNQKKENTLNGVVVDPNGAVVPNATVRLIKKNEKKVFMETRSGDDGSFAFKDLSEGVYRIEVPEVMGFRPLVVEKLRIRSGQTIDINLTLMVTGEVVGILVEVPLIEGPTSTVTIREIIDRIPEKPSFD